MNKSRLLGAAIACIAIFTTQQAMSLTIDTYFGWNYVSSVIATDETEPPISLPTLQLGSITYLGAGGSVTQTMPAFSGYGNTMPDGEGLGTKPTVTYTSGGDGETTRTVATSLPIDWIEAGVMTPWGVTYSFPTIGITEIGTQGVTGDLDFFFIEATGFCLGADPGATFPECTGGVAIPTGIISSQHVVGLIPIGENTELDSSLGGLQSDIYDHNGLVMAGGGRFIFSAASVPIPTTVVSIDIKPGRNKNRVNPRSKGGIWVAILSDTDSKSPFDPLSQVDIATIEFGPVGAKAIRHKVKDKNEDGLGDLLLRFKIPATGITCGDTEATLIGETFDSQGITGTDSIKTVGCKKPKTKKKKHKKK